MKIIEAIAAFIIGIVISVFVSPFAADYFGVFATAVLEVLFLVTPLLICFLKRENIKERFSLNLPSIRDFFGAALVFIGSVAISNELSVIIMKFAPLSNETDAAFLSEYFSNTSPFVALVFVALIPAICEEMLYRGYILNSFKTDKSRVILPIIASSVLFSAAHLDLYKALPVLVLGTGFGIIAVLSNSILLTVIAHFVNNSLSVIAFYATGNYSDTGSASLILGTKATVFISLIGLAFGVLLILGGIAVFKNKKIKGCLVGILAAVFLLFSFVGGMVAVSSEISEVLDIRDTQTINKTQTCEKDFVIDKNTICFPIVFAASENEKTVCNISITDEKGEEIISAHEMLAGQVFFAEKGKYKLVVTYEVPQDIKLEQKVEYTATVYTFAEYTTSPEQ